MANSSNPSDDVKKVADLIRNIEVAMLTTIRPDGSIHSRPMMTQEADFTGELWFFARRSSSKIQDIAHDQDVNLAYADPGKQQYVSLYGKAQVVENADRARELWSDKYQVWFPEGPEDPDLVLLKVRAISAEYWDAPGGTVVNAINFIKGALGGGQDEDAVNQEVRVN